MSLGGKLVGVVVLLTVSGCGGGANGGANGGAGKATASGPLATAPEQAQALFKANCQSCHGVDLSGRVGPQSNIQHVGAKLSQEQIANQITNGGGGMPALGGRLKPDEIQALATWLAGLK